MSVAACMHASDQAIILYLLTMFTACVHAHNVYTSQVQAHLIVQDLDGEQVQL